MSRAYWPRWAETLRHYRLHEFVASLIEAGSPLALFSAQALYFSRPFLGGEQIDALAATLEEESEARAFASFLMKEPR